MQGISWSWKGALCVKIHQVEQLVGITRRNIRFYEAEGLLSPGRDSQNGYRDYSESDVAELQKIKLLRKLDMPLERIRAIQENRVPLADALRAHVAELEHTRESLQNMQSICTLLSGRGEGYPTLDAAQYLAHIDGLEREGSRFVNIKKNDIRRKFIGPAVVAAVLIALMLYVIGLVAWALAADAENAPPFMLAALFFILPAAVIVGVILALIRRIRELKGGEEDAASQY